MSLQTFQTLPNADVTAAEPLLRDLIDYAGLFPPASLSILQSVANYDAYARSKWNWMLGRFVVPIARLGDFKRLWLDCRRRYQIESQNGGYRSCSALLRRRMWLLHSRIKYLSTIPQSQEADLSSIRWRLKLRALRTLRACLQPSRQNSRHILRFRCPLAARLLPQCPAADAGAPRYGRAAKRL